VWVPAAPSFDDRKAADRYRQFVLRLGRWTGRRLDDMARDRVRTVGTCPRSPASSASPSACSTAITPRRISTAAYGGYHMTVEMESGAVRGDFPPRALALVLEWARRHRVELLEDWERGRHGRPLQRIPPLE
jgi:hypothetical protein